nr:hypothetical protein [Tanacetum cinerariifolium]
MSTSRRTTTKDSGTGAAAVNIIAGARVLKKTRSTTPLSERIVTRDSFNTGKENITTMKTRSKPFVPQIVKIEKDKDGTQPRARWSSSGPRGRSASPCEFGRGNGGVNCDVSKTRVSRVSNVRNERSVSVDRSARVRDRAGLSNTRGEKSEKSEKIVENKANVSEKSNEMKAKNVKVVEKSDANLSNKANVRGEKSEKNDKMKAKNVKDVG